jgi:hypothetical protein
VRNGTDPEIVPCISNTEVRGTHVEINVIGKGDCGLSDIGASGSRVCRITMLWYRCKDGWVTRATVTHVSMKSGLQASETMHSRYLTRTPTLIQLPIPRHPHWQRGLSPYLQSNLRPGYFKNLMPTKTTSMSQKYNFTRAGQVNYRLTHRTFGEVFESDGRLLGLREI